MAGANSGQHRLLSRTRAVFPAMNDYQTAKSALQVLAGRFLDSDCDLFAVAAIARAGFGSGFARAFVVFTGQRNRRGIVQ